MLIDRLVQLVPYSIRYPLRKFYEFSKKSSLRELNSRFIAPGSLVFDIGANTGFYAEIFLYLGAKVICVEPHPYCIEELKKRFRNVPDIKILEMGVAENKGEIVLHIDSENNATASFSEKFITQGPLKNRHWGKELVVPVTTLDDLIDEYGKPVYCKIDVEGYELNVLEGLSTTIPYISFEYTKELLDDAERCLNRLEKLGEVRLNFTPAFDFTRLALKEWTQNKDELLAEIRKSSFEYAGDIYVMFV